MHSHPSHMASLSTAVLALASQMSVDQDKYKEVSVDVYLSQKGWHGLKDRMLVWMTTPRGAFTMLPNCTASVSKGNVDALGLREEVVAPWGATPNPHGSPPPAASRTRALSPRSCAGRRSWPCGA